MAKWMGHQLNATKASFLLHYAEQMHALLNMYKRWGKAVKVEYYEAYPPFDWDNATRDELLHFVWHLVQRKVIRGKIDAKGKRFLVMCPVTDEMLERDTHIQYHIDGVYGDD